MINRTKNRSPRVSRPWKFVLLAGAVIIVLATFAAGTYLAGEIRDIEKQRIELWAKASNAAAMTEELDESRYLDLVLSVLESNTTIPMILVDFNGNIISGSNFGKQKDKDFAFLERELQALQASGTEPIEIRTDYFRQYVYYKDSILLQYLTWFPAAVVLLSALFIMLAWFFYRSDKEAEQHFLWVGMAKETAHQLGTPISAMLAWVELMRTQPLNREEQDMMARELTKDVDRLQTVAERFSKIGSMPERELHNVYEELQKAISYIRSRAPRKVKFILPDMENRNIQVMLNAPLFNWVLENLFKNALDALDGRGVIQIDVFEDNDYVYIDVSDSGRGISPKIQQRIFQPGFTTKKRGWGLGLSLSKRIIDHYHQGKLFVKQSLPGEGTTFRIQLPIER